MNGHLKNPNSKNITKGAIDVQHRITSAPTFGLQRLMLNSAPSSIGMLTSAPCEFTL